VQPSRIVLAAAEGIQNREIPERLGVAPRMAALGRRRFIELSVAGLMKDAPRPGRTPAISPLRSAGVITRTTQSKSAGATHWLRSGLARETGISESSVGRIRRAHGLKAHRTESCKVCNDPTSPRSSMPSLGCI
jgi:transposase